MAIGAGDWAPQGKDAGLLIARFTDHLLSEGAENTTLRACP
jgi:hypothetical protein